MAQGVKLKTLIKDMIKTTNNLPNEINTKIDNIVARILFEIGYAMAYDTNTTRNLFMEILRTHFNNKALANKLYKDPYEHWNTIEQRQSDGDIYALNKVATNYKTKYDVMIQSDAFYRQDIIADSVSKHHPRGQDDNLKALMTEYVMDMFDTGSNTEIERLIIELEEDIIRVIEGRKNKRGNSGDSNFSLLLE